MLEQGQRINTENLLNQEYLTKIKIIKKADPGVGFSCFKYYIKENDEKEFSICQEFRNQTSQKLTPQNQEQNRDLVDFSKENQFNQVQTQYKNEDGQRISEIQENHNIFQKEQLLILDQIESQNLDQQITQNYKQISPEQQEIVELLRKLSELPWLDELINEQSQGIAPAKELSSFCYWAYISANYFRKETIESTLSYLNYIRKNDIISYNRLVQCNLESYIKSKRQQINSKEQIQKESGIEIQDKSQYDINDDIFLIQNKQITQNQKQKDISIDNLLDYYQKELQQITNNNSFQIEKIIQQIQSEQNLSQFNNQIDIIDQLYYSDAEESKYFQKLEEKSKQQKNLSVQIRKNSRNNQQSLNDEVCQVCSNGDSLQNNLIVFCSICNLSVHEECYGITNLPAGDWTCDLCIEFGEQYNQVPCVFCTQIGGAMKKTIYTYKSNILKNLRPQLLDQYNKLPKQKKQMSQINQNIEIYMPKTEASFTENDNKIIFSNDLWSHISCAKWVKGTVFQNDEIVSELQEFDRINKKNFLMTCSICNQKEGNCTVCYKSTCNESFHVECARRAGLKISNFDEQKKQIKFQAYCQFHGLQNDHKILDVRKIILTTELQKFCRKIRLFSQKIYEDDLNCNQSILNSNSGILKKRVRQKQFTNTQSELPVKKKAKVDHQKEQVKLDEEVKSNQSNEATSNNCNQQLIFQSEESNNDQNEQLYYENSVRSNDNIDIPDILPIQNQGDTPFQIAEQYNQEQYQNQQLKEPVSYKHFNYQQETQNFKEQSFNNYLAQQYISQIMIARQIQIQQQQIWQQGAQNILSLSLAQPQTNFLSQCCKCMKLIIHPNNVQYFSGQNGIINIQQTYCQCHTIQNARQNQQFNATHNQLFKRIQNIQKNNLPPLSVEKALSEIWKSR